ncbi:MAG: DUF4339 domain-containing protein [Phycisphaerae bacterium]|jgi:hypothetical protein
MASAWHYTKNGQKYGPVDTATLKLLAQSGQITVTDRVWRQGLDAWVPAAQVVGLFSTSASAGAMMPPPLTADIPSTVVNAPAVNLGATPAPAVKRKGMPSGLRIFLWIVVIIFALLLLFPVLILLVIFKNKIIGGFQSGTTDLEQSRTMLELLLYRFHC